MPLDRQNSVRAGCWMYGCASIWFTAGTMVAAASSSLSLRSLKLDTPIALVLPVFKSFSIAFQVSMNEVSLSLNTPFESSGKNFPDEASNALHVHQRQPTPNKRLVQDQLT